jgi:hypothetical protein
LLPSADWATALSPNAIAMLKLPPVAVALLPSPRATAKEPVPSAWQVDVPHCARTSPLAQAHPLVTDTKAPCWNWSRAQAITAHITGDSTGATGPLAASGPPKSPARADAMTFSGASGPENRANAGASATVVFNPSGPVGAGGSAAIAIGLDWSAPTLTEAARCRWTAATVAGGSVSVSTTACMGALSLLAADAGGDESGCGSESFVSVDPSDCTETADGAGAVGGSAATDGVVVATLGS